MTSSTNTSLLTAATTESPVGELTIVASDEGLVAILWDDDDFARCGLSADDVTGDVTADAHELIDRAREQLAEYFAGERTEFDVPLDPRGTDFQLAAWAALRTIPFGSTATYGAQARAMGDANKARAVGAANGKNPLSIVVPCHRVVGADGSLTGFAGGVDTKAWLLDHERVVLSRHD
ncbi:MAG: methylated-DNA--[protein]-cysteine S-methyltransferase [Actinomycetota bacterium]